MSTENLRFENIDDITVEKALTVSKPPIVLGCHQHDRVKQEAKKEGVFAGLTGGLASGPSPRCVVLVPQFIDHICDRLQLSSEDASSDSTGIQRFSVVSVSDHSTLAYCVEVRR